MKSFFLRTWHRIRCLLHFHSWWNWTWTPHGEFAWQTYIGYCAWCHRIGDAGARPVQHSKR